MKLLYKRKTIKILIENGADVNKKDCYGDTIKKNLKNYRENDNLKEVKNLLF